MALAAMLDRDSTLPAAPPVARTRSGPVAIGRRRRACRQRCPSMPGTCVVTPPPRHCCACAASRSPCDLLSTVSILCRQLANDPTRVGIHRLPWGFADPDDVRLLLDTNQVGRVEDQ